MPILWRECNWDALPIAKLQGASSKWIKSQTDMDMAWIEVSKKLKPVIEQAKIRRVEEDKKINR